MTIETTYHQSTDRKISLRVHPPRYGDNNATEAFEKKELAFELEIRNETSVLRNILTLKEVLKFKEQIDFAVEGYWGFMGREE